MDDTKESVVTKEKKEEASTWDLNDFLFDEKLHVTTEEEKKNDNDKVDPIVKKTEVKEGNTVTQEDNKTLNIDDIKEKSQEEIDTFIDSEVNRRLEGTAKTKEEVVIEINKELGITKENTDEIDFTPFYDLLHKELGFKDLADENKPQNSIKGFTDHIQAIINENSRPEFASKETEAFDKYVRNGYDPKKYLNQMFGEPDYENMKIGTEIEQKAMLDNYFRVKNPNWSTVKRTEKISRLESAGLLEDEAKDAHEELKVIFANREERVKQDLANEEKLKVQQWEDWQRKLHNDIFTQSKIAGFDFPEQDKKGLFDFITKKDINGETEYNKVLASPLERLSLSYFAFKGLNKNKFDIKAETSVTERLRKSLSRFSDSAKGGGGLDSEGSIQKPGQTDYEAFIIK